MTPYFYTFRHFSCFFQEVKIIIFSCKNAVLLDIKTARWYAYSAIPIKFVGFEKGRAK